MKGLGYITLSEAEEISGIKADTWKKRCQEGQVIGAIKQGKTWFIPREQVIKEQNSPVDDKLLSLFAMMAEGGLVTSVTLFVGGMILAGELVSYKEYIKQLKEKFYNSSQTKEMNEDLNKLFDLLFTNLEKKVPPTTEEALSKPIYNIHLQNVSVKEGQVWTNFNYIMRIKLNAIDGFIWGKPDTLPLPEKPTDGRRTN